MTRQQHNTTNQTGAAQAALASMTFKQNKSHAIAGTTARCAVNFGTYRSLQRHRAVFTVIGSIYGSAIADRQRCSTRYSYSYS